MVTLVVGGAASGKSQFAEGLVLAAGDLPRYYIATMQPFDGECRARIRRHRAMRAQKGFETIERYTSLSGVTLPRRGAVLLECVSNLAANELYSPQGAGAAAGQAILQGVRSLKAQCRELVIVSNEVFSGGCDYAGDTLRYLRVLGEVNRLLAREADRVYEIVCGLPVRHK